MLGGTELLGCVFGVTNTHKERHDENVMSLFFKSVSEGLMVSIIISDSLYLCQYLIKTCSQGCQGFTEST